MRNKLTSWCALSWLIGALLLQLAGMAHAGSALTPHTAEYKIRISVLGGKLQTQLLTTEDGYRAVSSIKATGMSRLIAHGDIRESSFFSESAQGLRPMRYESSDTLSKDGQVVDLEFDWNTGEVGGTIDGADFRAGLEGIVHDRVSLQYGLMYDLLRGVERSDYALQDAEKFKQLSITNIGRKPVEVPFGRFEAVGIQHQAANSSRVTTLWCVAELGFLPVIIEQHRKGKLRLRAELTEYNPVIEEAAGNVAAQ